ncbi:MAG TPA: hypothetical protein VNT99_12160 [Methylomirabilota bacterium]|nr:hypothetical protein [Methylomirabilota bacterium]
MFKGELAQLQQRKKELLFEGDINRQILRVECCQLKLKATEWKRGLLQARTAYQWMAPLAGVGFAIYGMKKKLHARVKHNGHGRGKSVYLKLLAPLGLAAMRKAFSFWQHARKRGETA